MALPGTHDAGAAETAAAAAAVAAAACRDAARCLLRVLVEGAIAQLRHRGATSRISVIYGSFCDFALIVEFACNMNAIVCDV